MTKQRTIRMELLLTPEEDQALTDYAAREGISRAEAIRRSMRMLLHIPRPARRKSRATERQEPTE